MSNYGTMLLSRVLDEASTQPLKKHHVEPSHFISEADRKAYDFILKYERENGQAPSYATVVTEIPEFFYVAGVDDSYTYLIRKLKGESALTEFVDFVGSGELQTLLNEHKSNPTELFDAIKKRMESIDNRTNVRDNIGTDIKKDADKYLAEYDRRKEGKSFKTWKSKFEVIGEYVSGNMYTVYGKSGRGKSVISLEDCVYMAQQGANVLVWSMEMPTFEVLTRAFVSLSGDAGITLINEAGINMEAGFDANDVRNGRLGAEFEEAFKKFVYAINDTLAGNIIVRGVDDPEFHTRNLRALEADIIASEADVVLVDPFYYLDYESNTSKTTGGDAANTSIKLRRLTGQLSVVTIAITQADEEDQAEDDDGNREISLPKRKDVKKTKQLLEDATTLIPVDTDYKQKRGLVGNNKGRNGGEGDVCEILYMPQYGVVKSLMAETSANDFVF